MSKLVPTVYERQRKVWKSQTERRVPTTENTYKTQLQTPIRKTYSYEKDPIDYGSRQSLDKEKYQRRRNWDDTPSKLTLKDCYRSPYKSTYTYNVEQDPLDSGLSYTYDREKRHNSEIVRRNWDDTPSKLTKADRIGIPYSKPYSYDIELEPLDDGVSYSYDSEKRRESEVMRRNWDDTFHKVAPRADDWKLDDAISKLDDAIATSNLDDNIRNRIYPMEDLKIGALDSDFTFTDRCGSKNPIVEDRFGQRKFRIEYELADYKPEEITVKLSGRFLTVSGKHEERGGVKSSKKEYSRQYLLPPEVRPELLTAKLGYTGKLTIEGPVSPKGRDKDMIIPVKYGY